MKNFFKMFFIIVMAFFLLGAGFYITISNVSRLIAAGKPRWQCHWGTTGLQVKTGKWCETINLQLPFQVRRQAHNWIIHGRDFHITVNTRPKLRIQWKK
jgi:hypothetical protein